MLRDSVAAAAARQERLLTAIAVVVPLAVVALIGWVVVHFVAKFW